MGCLPGCRSDANTGNSERSVPIVQRSFGEREPFQAFTEIRSLLPWEQPLISS
jgi:hypothetical protein